jgi:hypothetical protein
MSISISRSTFMAVPDSMIESISMRMAKAADRIVNFGIPSHSRGFVLDQGDTLGDSYQDDSIYSTDMLDELVDDDCISAEERAFMEGYISEDDYEDYEE